MRDLLRNLTLNTVLFTDAEFFNYDDEEGIDFTTPGLEAELMDQLALRAGFKWRNSFGIMPNPETWNETFTELLWWSVNTYDVSVSWWDMSVDRMERGIAFIEPWFDGSVILIDQEDPPEVNDKIVWLNWTLPFEPEVWLMILLTIFASAAVFQWIEYMHTERDDRTMSQWFRDNLYLSTLNFTQNYEYAPNSSPARIFGVSMALWSLVMTATYTANLASLFVEELKPPIIVETIDQAIALDYSICTYANTNADVLIKTKYQNVKRVPKTTELEGYQALRDGECYLYTGYKDTWLSHRGDREYNPECDLEWVGRTVEIIKSGIAVKADSGNLCSGVIRDVLNLYMMEMILEGVLEDLWERHRSQTKDIDCDAEDPDAILTERQRGLATENENKIQKSTPRYTGNRDRKNGADNERRRKLKSASKSGSDDEETTSLSLRQMAGTFTLHYGMMFVAMVVSYIGVWTKKSKQRRKNDQSEDPNPEHILSTTKEQRSFRGHGPVIGSHPRANTFVVRSNRGMPLECLPETETSNTSGSSDSSNLPSNWEEAHQRLQAQQETLGKQQEAMSEQIQDLKSMLESMQEGEERTRRVLGAISRKLEGPNAGYYDSINGLGDTQSPKQN